MKVDEAKRILEEVEEGSQLSFSKNPDESMEYLDYKENGTFLHKVLYRLNRTEFSDVWDRESAIGWLLEIEFEDAKKGLYNPRG